MKDEFVNRLGMFRTATGTLNRPEYLPVWQNQPPQIFTTKATAAMQAVEDLADFTAQQQAVLTGAADRKATEEDELEQEAFRFGGVLAIWLRDQGDTENAAKVDFPLSGWRRMRDETLLQQARLLQQLGEAALATPEATTAEVYGITPAALAKLTKEADDFAAVISNPQQAIAERKARTRQLRDRFNEVESQFQTLDRLIELFHTTPEGRNLIAAWHTSRIIRDLGPGPLTPPSPDQPTAA